jgi:hypothetical protein
MGFNSAFKGLKGAKKDEGQGSAENCIMMAS